MRFKKLCKMKVKDFYYEILDTAKQKKGKEKRKIKWKWIISIEMNCLI